MKFYVSDIEFDFKTTDDIYSVSSDDLQLIIPENLADGQQMTRMTSLKRLC